MRSSQRRFIQPEAPDKAMALYSENRESNEAPLECRDSHLLVIKYLD